MVVVYLNLLSLNNLPKPRPATTSLKNPVAAGPPKPAWPNSAATANTTNGTSKNEKNTITIDRKYGGPFMCVCRKEKKKKWRKKIMTFMDYENGDAATGGEMSSSVYLE